MLNDGLTVTVTVTAAHYGFGATAVGANRRRLMSRPSRPDILQVVETLGRELRKEKIR